MNFSVFRELSAKKKAANNVWYCCKKQASKHIMFFTGTTLHSAPPKQDRKTS